MKSTWILKWATDDTYLVEAKVGPYGLTGTWGPECDAIQFKELEYAKGIAEYWCINCFPYPTIIEVKHDS